MGLLLSSSCRMKASFNHLSCSTFKEGHTLNMYILSIRSLLEQSATVWHSSPTEENKSNLKRVQKSAVKVILGNEYENYQKALSKLDLENLRLG